MLSIYANVMHVILCNAVVLPCQYHDNFSFIIYHHHFLIILSLEINFFVPPTPFWQSFWQESALNNEA